MYFDLRIRTEGFDLTVLTQSMSDEQTDVSEVTTEVPRPEKGNLVTMTEMGYFALIEVGAVILYIILVVILFAFFALLGVASGAPEF